MNGNQRLKMSDTPRTDKVQEAARQLPMGSMVVIPEDHPPYDPWELCRQLERELNEIRENSKIKLVKGP